MEEAPDRPEEWHWSPKLFMTDFCEREKYVIEETFEGYTTHIYIYEGVSSKRALFCNLTEVRFKSAFQL